MHIELSICIPTYNRAYALSETLASIVSQAGDTVEIVVSDNASTDSTAEVIKSFRDQFKNITYYRQSENVGADRNYLQVVELARGQYCWLFGSDDVMRDGALSKMLKELRSDADIYLVGFTVCTRDMIPIKDHAIWLRSTQQVFDLEQPDERRRYFQLAVTTTALFSFLGSIVVKKMKWDRSVVDEAFIGSLWIHVAKCFGIIPFGLKLKMLPESFLLKRGDNDSFMERGMVARVAIAIEGFIALGRQYFGMESVELVHIRRVLMNEWSLTSFVLVREKLLSENTTSQKRLDSLFDACYCGTSLYEKIARVAYAHKLGRILVRLINKVRVTFGNYRALLIKYP